MNASPASASPVSAPGFTDQFWTSQDGLRLHYRDYAGRDDRPAILCLPGLTRNARDFHDVAQRLGGQWRVICPDLRGRGDSAYAKDSASYNPLQYVEDIGALLEQARIDRFVAIGTSLGGLMIMMMAMQMPDRIAGALLNDVGPEISPDGLERIRGYVGQGRSFSTWMHAARALVEAQGAVFPEYSVTDWLDMAKRAMVVGSNGRIVFDYDMRIAEPMAQASGDAAIDLWPALLALKGRPVTLLRGTLSDVLAKDVFRKMAKSLPGSDAVEVPRVGHAPMLTESEAVAAIERLLTRVG